MSHTYAKLLYHCVFSTKARLPQIENPMRDRLYAYIGGILEHRGGRLIRAGGSKNHIHLLTELGATVSVSDVMRDVKANSSKWIHETFPAAASFQWQTGYAAFTVSTSAARDVIRYLEHQDEHHQTRTFEQEFVEFLRRHGIEFDERHVLDLGCAAPLGLTDCGHMKPHG